MVDQRTTRQTSVPRTASKRSLSSMDPDFDPLAGSHEQAKAISAGALAVLLVGFVLGIHLITGGALLVLIVAAARWIQLGNRLRERDSEPEAPVETDPEATPSNIIPFRRPAEPPPEE